MSEYKSEIRDGMRIDWDVPIAMDDGIVLRADVFRPIAPGSYPALVSYGPYGKGLAFQEGYKTAWDIMARENPDALAGSTQQISELGSGRSREVGAGRLRLRARRFARRRPLARLPRPQRRSARPQDFHDCIEWAAHAVLVQRQGGHERHFVLREQPVARRRDAAAASRRDLRLGRLDRQLPRSRATAASSASSARTGRTCRSRRCSTAWASAARRSRVTGELGMRTRDAFRRRAGEEPRRHVGGAPRASCSTDYYRERSGRSLEGHRAAALRRRTGAGRDCIRAATSKASCARIEAEMAGSARRLALGAVLYRLRRQAAEALLRLFPERRNNGWDQQPRVQLQVRHPGEKFVRARTKTNGRSRARSGRISISIRKRLRLSPNAA